MGYLIYPDNDFLCTLYADALVKAGKPTEAGILYNHALKINPNNVPAAKGLATLKVNQR